MTKNKEVKKRKQLRVPETAWVEVKMEGVRRNLDMGDMFIVMWQCYQEMMKGVGKADRGQR